MANYRKIAHCEKGLHGPGNISMAVERIRSMGARDLEALWQKTFRKDVPDGLTRDLQIRMLAWDVQERAFGSHGPETLKVLNAHAGGRPDRAALARRLKPGTELIREYQGERHCVTVLESGYRWRGASYKSLSVIARAITGSTWNGPRFFGLRAGRGPTKTDARLPKLAAGAIKIAAPPSDAAKVVDAAGGPPGE